MLIRGEDSAIELPFYANGGGEMALRSCSVIWCFGRWYRRQKWRRCLRLQTAGLRILKIAPEPVNVTEDEYSGVLNNVQYGDRIFERLSLNEKA